MKHSVFKSVEVHHGMLVNTLLFEDFGSLFAKGASESSMNDMLYKDSEYGFRSCQKASSTKDHWEFFIISKVYRRMLINIIGFQ